MTQRIENPEQFSSLSRHQHHPQPNTQPQINTPGVPPGPPEAHQRASHKTPFPQRRFVVLQELVLPLIVGQNTQASELREYFLEQFIWKQLTPEGFWSFGDTVSRGLCDICFETGPCRVAFWNIVADEVNEIDEEAGNAF